MKKYALLVSLIFLAGCLGGGTGTKVDTNAGVVVTQFTITPSVANSGELTLFESDIENVGGTTARNIKLDFFGVEEQWRDDTGTLVDSTRQQTVTQLRPPEPARNLPGDSRQFQDQLMTPSVPQGLSKDFLVLARVSYDYNTSGIVTVPAISEDEYRRRQSGAQATDFPVDVRNSAGPIQLTMDAKSAPIRVDTTSTEDFQVWPLKILLTNQGTGFPITTEDDSRIIAGGGKLTGTIELTGPGAEFDNCLGQTSGTLINLNSVDIPLRIKENRQASLPCTIKIDKSVWNDRPTDSVSLVFNLVYRYYSDKSATVKVNGR